VTGTQARTAFDELKDRSGRVADAELDDFWATLAPATVEDMIGEWGAASSTPATT
jgi:hypothetical protein